MPSPLTAGFSTIRGQRGDNQGDVEHSADFDHPVRNNAQLFMGMLGRDAPLEVYAIAVGLNNGVCGDYFGPCAACLAVSSVAAIADGVLSFAGGDGVL